jgi:hypothetical protein
MNKISSPDVEMLVINTSPLNDLEIAVEESDAWYDWRRQQDPWAELRYMRWTQQLTPIESLTPFTKLRKIVAAQEAFFSVDESFSVCELPASVEEIGMVDTTCAIDRWLRWMLENKYTYPNLKIITFWGRSSTWRNDFQDIFDWDPRLGNENDFP